jgi:hypothetical protein
MMSSNALQLFRRVGPLGEILHKKNDLLSEIHFTGVETGASGIKTPAVRGGRRAGV